jgi:hypothetical protein
MEQVATVRLTIAGQNRRDGSHAAGTPFGPGGQHLLNRLEFEDPQWQT